MLKIINEEAKTEEEAVEKVLKTLNCTKEDIYYRGELIEGKLFKSSKYNIEAIKKEDVMNSIKSTIEEIGNLMNIRIETEIKLRDNEYNVTLISDNNSILIGKDGKTLNSMQSIIRQSIKNSIHLNIKINLDVANYKINKMKNIESEVKKIASEVKLSKVEASLDPMNSYERRLVHSIIDEFENLTTESIGEGKDRHVVIKYIEKA